MARHALAALMLCLSVASSTAYSREDTVSALLKAKEVLAARGPNWRAATANWVCAGPPGGPGCDPCAPEPEARGGDEWWSEWTHIACRGGNSYLADVPGGGTDGRVTNIHFTQGGVEGGFMKGGNDPAAIIEALCPLGRVGVAEGLPSSVTEVDITSSIRNADPALRIAGPLPPSFAACFPAVHQLEWSYNALNGSLPGWVVGMANLSYFKVRANEFTGSIPAAYGSMPQLFRLDLGKNRLTGPIPTSFRNHPSLGIFQVDGNAGLEGDLLGLSGTHLQVAMVSPNPGLCGPIPASVRFAVGFNTTGTNLGKPCPRGMGVSELLEPEPESAGAAVAAASMETEL